MRKKKKRGELFVCGHLPFLLSSIETKLSSHPKVDHELHMPKDVLTHKKSKLYPKTFLSYVYGRCLIEFSCFFCPISNLIAISLVKDCFVKYSETIVFILRFHEIFQEKKRSNNFLFHEIFEDNKSKCCRIV